jgi:hypothetical protein
MLIKRLKKDFLGGLKGDIYFSGENLLIREWKAYREGPGKGFFSDELVTETPQLWDDVDYEVMEQQVSDYFKIPLEYMRRVWLEQAEASRDYMNFILGFKIPDAEPIAENEHPV